MADKSAKPKVQKPFATLAELRAAIVQEKASRVGPAGGRKLTGGATRQYNATIQAMSDDMRSVQNLHKIVEKKRVNANGSKFIKNFFEKVRETKAQIQKVPDSYSPKFLREGAFSRHPGTSLPPKLMGTETGHAVLKQTPGLMGKSGSAFKRLMPAMNRMMGNILNKIPSQVGVMADAMRAAGQAQEQRALDLKTKLEANKS